MLILLLGDGHMTCLAVSALFPLITSSDLQDFRIKDIMTVLSMDGLIGNKLLTHTLLSVEA